jgi:hypothetical protein
MARDRVEESTNKTEVLPALQDDSYTLEAFTPIGVDAADHETTASDLAILNNHLALCSMALPSIRTVAGLCVLSTTVTKLIEARRKVKKLAYGDSNGKRGSAFEVIE